MLIVLPNTFGDAPANMAVDAALLQTLPPGIAVFRHYGWTEPAVTFGYTQKYRDVAHAAPPGAQLCRRLTGGGIVDHRSDWTYALVVHGTIPAGGGPATDIYRNIHRCIRAALAEQGVHCSLAPCVRSCAADAPDADPMHADQAASHSVPSQCFVSPVTNDVLSRDGAKIAGAAMKRTRSGLLIQGSLARSALPDTFDYAAFTRDIPPRFAGVFDLRIGTVQDVRPLYDADQITKERDRFRDPEWNRRR